MFITFEGLDGAGKSTQIQRLVAQLEAHRQMVVATREPGGTHLGDELRKILLDPSGDPIAPATEALLYATSRAQLVAQVIVPALTQGQHVLCDRYVDASIAYQGAGLGLGVERVAGMNEFATGGLQPDLTFLFDVPVETSQERVSTVRGEQPPDRIEQRDAAYFHRVREQFLSIAREDQTRVVIVDATLGPDVLEKEIWTHVEKRLDKNTIL